MIKCIKCHALISKDAKKCPYCGYNMEEAVKLAKKVIAKNYGVRIGGGYV